VDDNESSFFGFVVRWTHKSLEKAVSSSALFPVVLEVGAGSGRHQKYVKHRFEKYIQSDLRYSPNKLNVSHNGKVIIKKVDAQALKGFEDGSVHRLLATCVLIHMQNPMQALNEWKRVIDKESGILTIYVPCEPGLVLRLLRNLTTVRRARKFGANHLSFHYKEHPYHYPFMRTIINEIFSDFQIQWKFYPFLVGSWNLNLWSICTISPRMGLKS
jgi:ubiquinone/menaquinone biosynthesis C-methylase UbiE